MDKILLKTIYEKYGFVLIFIAGVIFLIYFLRKKIKEWRINR